MYKFTYETPYATYNDCQFMIGRYNNGNLGVEIWGDTEGPITKVTINPGIKLDDDYIAIKNYSGNENIEQFLKSEGLIAEEPVKLIASGWVMIPIYKLTEKGKEVLTF